MSISINVKDELMPKLDIFDSDKTKLRLANNILGRTGRKYAAQLKRNYLRGQMINGGKGADSLYGRIRVYRSKRQKYTWIIAEKTRTGETEGVKLSNIYEHEGGYTILPKRAKTLKFIGSDGKPVFVKKVEGKSRPFISSSSDAFPWNQTLEAMADEVVEKELEKDGLK